MKDKLITQLKDIRDEIAYGIRWLCKCPSPGKRLVTVLILSVILGGTNIYFVVSSIYNIGKRDAELIHIEHIKQLEFKHSSDSINNQLNKKLYEYEESDK
jgi:hypothetical protein